jgi:hypothetical protein
MSDTLRALERLGHEVERIAREADATRAARSTRRGRLHMTRRAMIVALVTFIVIAAAAVAATTGLLTGTPVSNPKGVGFTPKRGWGAPIAGTVRLSALRVPDPGGGPPWGLRTFRTTRGLACVQVGRVQDGKLGVLGQDGAFADDGRFHEWPADVVGQTFCQERDGAGHAFIDLFVHGLPASALSTGCAVAAGAAPLPNCPRQDVRVVHYGLLGPEAVEVTYRDEAAALRTAPVAKPDGAFLIVYRPSADHPAKGYFSVGVSPAAGLVSVRYRSEPECRIGNPRRHGGARSCALVGYVPPVGARVTSSQVRTAVHATLARHLTRLQAPRGRSPAVAPATASIRVRRLTLRFRARVATRGAATRYTAFIDFRHSHGCGQGGMGLGTDRDIAAGEVVTLHADLSHSCRGPVRGFVAFHQQRGKPGPALGMNVPWRDVRVGTFTARLSSGP